MFWKAPFIGSCEHYKILSKVWDRGIVRNGKTLLIGKSEHSKKSAYSVLATRDSAEVARRAKRAIRTVVEFKYDSAEGWCNIWDGNLGETVRGERGDGSRYGGVWLWSERGGRGGGERCEGGGGVRGV